MAQPDQSRNPFGTIVTGVKAALNAIFEASKCSAASSPRLPRAGLRVIVVVIVGPARDAVNGAAIEQIAGLGVRALRHVYNGVALVSPAECCGWDDKEGKGEQACTETFSKTPPRPNYIGGESWPWCTAQSRHDDTRCVCEAAATRGQCWNCVPPPSADMIYVDLDERSN
jgi:hypothetical protein